MKRLIIAVVMFSALSLRAGDVSQEVIQIRERIDAMKRINEIQGAAMEDDAEMVAKLMRLNNREVDVIINPHIKLLTRSVRQIIAVQKKNWPTR